MKSWQRVILLMSRLLLRTAMLLFLFVGFTTACSENVDPGSNGENQNNNGELDAGEDTDQSDADPDSDIIEPDFDAENHGEEDAEEDVDANADVDDDVVEEDEYPKEVTGACGAMIDLGTIEWETYQLEVDFDYFDNDLHTKCDLDATGDIAIYKFQTPTFHTSSVFVDTEGQAAIEVRIGACDSDDPTVGCYPGETEVAMMPGYPHYLILERLDDSSDSPMDVEVEFFEMPPCPMEEEGQVSCVDDNRIEACQLLLISADTPRKFTAECPTGVCANDRCIGDSCDAPIQVTSSFQWSGMNLGFLDTWDNNYEYLQARAELREPTCVDGSADPSLKSTPGRELVFELPDLTQGTVVELEVNIALMDDVLVIVTDTCDTGALCEEAWQAVPEMTFTAPSDGTFYVIVDTRYDVNGFLDISIEIDPED